MKTQIVTTVVMIAMIAGPVSAQDNNAYQHTASAQPKELAAQLEDLRNKVQLLELQIQAPKTSDSMSGMNMSGGSSGGMGMMSGMGGMKMSGNDGAMSGMDGMGMMGMGKDMMGMMGMMKDKRGMSGMAMQSALPGFPGASHLYHIGATGFFLDHPQHITLTTPQQTELNQIKEKAVLAQASAERNVEEAEQQLWELTSAPEPDAKKIESKIREIERLRGDQRMAFIRAVGEAAQVLTHEQHLQLTGAIEDGSTDSKSNHQH